MTVYDVLLIVISEQTDTERSRQVLYYMVKDTLLRERRGFTPILLPIHLDNALQKMRGTWVRLLQMAQHQSRDFTRWHDGNFYQAALARLLYDLKVESVQ